MKTKYIILRRVIFNGTIIEEDRYFGDAPSLLEGERLASLLNDDTLRINHALKGFRFEFYVKVFEE